MEWRVTALIPVVAAAVLGGCVERELTITSDPSGAIVRVSHVEVGRTPVTIPFTWYGDYDIRLRHEGKGGRQWKPLDTHGMIDPPVYEVPPLDLLSAMAPWWYRDHRYLHFELEPQDPVDPDELRERAAALRQRNLEPVRD